MNISYVTISDNVHLQIGALSNDARQDFHLLIQEVQNTSKIPGEFIVNNMSSVSRVLNSGEKYNVIFQRVYSPVASRIEILKLETPEELRREEFQYLIDRLNPVSFTKKILVRLDHVCHWFGNGQKLGSLVISMILLIGLFSTIKHKPLSINVNRNNNQIHKENIH